MAVSGCAAVPSWAQRLSGPVEHDKASESRSSLAQGANRDMDPRFQNVPVWAEKPCDSPVTEQSVIGLHSEGYTKARSLGLTVCLTADLEKLNLTAKYCGPEQACTVRCNHRSWVLRLHCLIQTCWVLLSLLAWMDAFGYSWKWSNQAGSHDNSWREAGIPLHYCLSSGL